MAAKNWKKVEPTFEGGRLIKLDKTGMSVEGKLIKVREVPKYKTLAYDIQTDTELVTILGTSNLNFKMRDVKIGTTIKIEYNKDEISKTSRRSFKVFDVYME
jgi:hypothetical protein